MSEGTRIITLTDAPPARIRDEEWPVIAFGKWHDGELEFWACKGWMYIRRHVTDGRTIVYGGLDMPWNPELNLRAGELVVAGSDLVDAIARVAIDAGADRDFADRMIAKLPPVEI